MRPTGDGVMGQKAEGVVGHKAAKITFDSIRAEYDAAKTTQDNYRRWQYTDALSANEANSRSVRQTLVQRARYEAANNAYCSGIIESLAHDCIGTGPHLQIL